MITIDLLLALVLVAMAAGFLVWNLGFRKAAPPCHPPSAPRRAASADVILDDKLARALAKAKAKARAR